MTLVVVAVLTKSQLIEQIIGNLQGFVEDQETVTATTSAIGPTDTTFTVDDTSSVTAGITEVGSELMWVKKVDHTSNTVTVMPAGRGWQGTTAASHASNTLVRNNPRFPRARVSQAIDQVIDSLSPDLYVITTTDITDLAAVSTYALPASVIDVLSVVWESVGPSREWVPVRTWRLNPAPAGQPNAIQVSDVILPGRTIRVTYTTNVQPWSDLWSETGLPDSCQDMVMYGACAALVDFLEPGRITTQAVEAEYLQQAIPSGASTNLARYYTQKFLQRRDEEQRKLQDSFPTVIHRTR